MLSNDHFVKIKVMNDNLKPFKDELKTIAEKRFIHVLDNRQYIIIIFLNLFIHIITNSEQFYQDITRFLLRPHTWTLPIGSCLS